MDWKSFVFGMMSIVLLVLVLISFGIVHLGSSAQGYLVSGSAVDGNMPEKCKVPPGQDAQKWKEHLGHHADTRDCLNYYR